MKNITNKVVLITGAGSGIGKASAELYVQNGCKVYGIARHEFNIKGVTSIKGDVSNLEEMKKAVDLVITKEGRIDILVSNAGIGISGSVEFCDTADIKNLFDVNFMGAVHMCQCVLPHMRAQKSGRIIFTSSVQAFIPIPYMAYYSAFKAALDSIACALRLELKPFNIKVCCVQPGDTQTGFTANRKKKNNDVDNVYDKRENKAVACMEKDEGGGMSPQKIARVIVRCSRRKNPPYTRCVGPFFVFVKWAKRHLPERFMMWCIKVFYHA